MDERTSRLSPEGRLRSDETLQVAREKKRLLALDAHEACCEFEKLIGSQLGHEPTATESALRLTASCAFTSMWLLRQRLTTSRTQEQLEKLSEQIAPVARTMMRAMKALLGIDSDADKPEYVPDFNEVVADILRKQAEDNAK